MTRKILIIGNGAIGEANGQYSINKHTAQFCKELVDLELTIGFLQFQEKIQDNEGLQDHSLHKDIIIHSLQTNKKKGKFAKLISYFSMLKLIIKTLLKYDFIYIFYPGHVPVIASVSCILLRKKYGLYIRGQHNLETKTGRFLVKHAKFCLTVSDLLKAQVEKTNPDIEVIAPMIDFSKQDILLNRDYSHDNIMRCLFVGRVEYRKGVYDLIKAIKLLNDKYDYLHFDIVGGGDSFEDVKSKTENYANVTLHGQISTKKELLAMYRQADIFIFPSHDEGFPRVLYEAMMARLPIATTLVGGIGGVMKNHHNCLEIEPENDNSILQTVSQLLESEELRIKLVDQATKDVSKLFDGSRVKHSNLVFNKTELYL